MRWARASRALQWGEFEHKKHGSNELELLSIIYTSRARAWWYSAQLGYSSWLGSFTPQIALVSINPIFSIRTVNLVFLSFKEKLNCSKMLTALLAFAIAFLNSAVLWCSLVASFGLTPWFLQVKYFPFSFVGSFSCWHLIVIDKFQCLYSSHNVDYLVLPKRFKINYSNERWKKCA